MPSRRATLAGIGGTLTAILAGRTALGMRTRDAAQEWPMARYDPAGTSHNPDAAGPTDGVQVVWERELGTSFRGESPAPILLDGTLYAVNGERLVALDSETGDRVFEDDGPYGSVPARAAASIYHTDTLAVTSPAGVYGMNAGGGMRLGPFDRRIGSIRWEGPGRTSGRDFFGPPQSPPPVAVGERIYAPVPGTEDVVCLEANDGSVRWTVAPGEDTDFDGAGVTTQPAIRNGKLFLTGPFAAIVAYDADTGDFLWDAYLEDAPQPLFAPTATESAVIVSSRGTLTCLEADGGAIRWTVDLDGWSTEGSAAVADGRVFIADGEETIQAIDVETGETIWSAPFAGQQTPVVAEDVVYATRRSLEVVAFDAETGDRRWAYDEPEWQLSSPIAVGERLYLLDGTRAVALEEAT